MRKASGCSKTLTASYFLRRLRRFLMRRRKSNAGLGSRRGVATDRKTVYRLRSFFEVSTMASRLRLAVLAIVIVAFPIVAADAPNASVDRLRTDLTYLASA